MQSSTNVVPFVRPPAAAGRRKPKPLTSEERDALVESHLPQVRYIAGRMAAKLPPSVERDDLVGAGIIGLIDAVGKFDPSRGVLFKTYAERRVRGAMLDSLRDLDWVPRSVRRRAREVEATCGRLERELGRSADDDEVAAALGITMQAFHERVGEIRTVSAFADETEEARQDRVSRVADDGALSPLATCEREETRRQLAAAVASLPDRERKVIALYYVEDLTMKEIGSVLSVTESRVSQLRSQAVGRLRISLSRVAA